MARSLWTEKQGGGFIDNEAYNVSNDRSDYTFHFINFIVVIVVVVCMYYIDIELSSLLVVVFQPELV